MRMWADLLLVVGPIMPVRPIYMNKTNKKDRSLHFSPSSAPTHMMPSSIQQPTLQTTACTPAARTKEGIETGAAWRRLDEEKHRVSPEKARTARSGQVIVHGWSGLQRRGSPKTLAMAQNVESSGLFSA
jgi:hypothetical protein